MKSDLHPPPNESLIGKWRHSHEEDFGTIMVFRASDYSFPPSRGRIGFQIEGDGQAIFQPLGRDDREQQRASSWELSTDSMLSIRDRATGGMLFQGRLMRIDAGRLELSRGPASTS